MKRLNSGFLLAGFLVLALASITLGLPRSQATAASFSNNVNVNFKTAWVYDSPGDNFIDSQVTGYKWWQSSAQNSPDETKSPITSLSLSLESNHVFENLDAKSLITKGPPIYGWTFGNIPEGNEASAWVDSRLPSGSVSYPVNFTAGFDASRSADKTKFSAPGLQTLTITVTPRESIQAIGIYVGVFEDKNADTLIISPMSDNTTRLSPDGHGLMVNLTGLNLNVTYTTVVTIRVTPKASEVTLIPQVNVMELDKEVTSGSKSGSSIIYPVGELADKVGIWTWQTQSNCLWQWRETLSRWVIFKGTVYGPQGQGTGKSDGGPQPAFSWRIDIGLAIGLVIISPALYFAGRRFRRQRRSLNLTWVVYPLIISFTGWYTLTSIYRIIYVPSWNPGVDVLVYTLTWSTVPLAFSYAALKKVKLEFKWTALSVVGMILSTYFLIVAISEFLTPVLSPSDIFFTGIWDHTYFPLAFGLLMLCDLNKMPKIFWFILLPMSLGNVGALRELMGWVHMTNPHAPSLMFYFGVESRAELLALPQDKLMVSLIIFLREWLGFILLIPALFCYFFFKSLWKSISGLIKKHSDSSPKRP